MAEHSEAWRDRQRTVLADLRGDYSQEEISRRMDLGYWRYVHLEQAKTRLTNEEFWLFCGFYGLTPFDLARRLSYPCWTATSRFAVRMREHGVPDEAIRELLSDLDGRTLHAEAADAIARHVAQDEAAHPRRTEGRRANGS